MLFNHGHFRASTTILKHLTCPKSSILLQGPCPRSTIADFIKAYTANEQAAALLLPFFALGGYVLFPQRHGERNHAEPPCGPGFLHLRLAPNFLWRIYIVNHAFGNIFDQFISACHTNQLLMVWFIHIPVSVCSIPADSRLLFNGMIFPSNAHPNKAEIFT